MDYRRLRLRSNVQTLGHSRPADLVWDTRPLNTPDSSGLSGAGRRIRIFPRSSTPINFYSFENTKTTPHEQISTLTDGVQLVIEDLEGYGDVTLMADRVVIWSQTTDGQGLGSLSEM